ncbi:dynein heavy chain [Volvox carteri f. nagariensis]|uniref:Dynein heavy chain n=1 Tax=Volvox carteri f. nagariensis TaxID=3068 RepID=D8TLN2_VOLCA|nr:dynein heavy chain [Volvox carteri f. nagariensis]EFJ51362.1 dynein heavy chain [Volvox carteri f. nagariensis]|eukprot:XP_002947314.1 dynein heavy chain [Volvox carteri f. nagariensis]
MVPRLLQRTVLLGGLAVLLVIRTTRVPCRTRTLGTHTRLGGVCRPPEHPEGSIQNCLHKATPAAVSGWLVHLPITLQLLLDPPPPVGSRLHLSGCIRTGQLGCRGGSCPRRFLSQLMMVALPAISHTGFHAIFTDMVTKLMTPNTTLPFTLVDLLVEATLDLYRKVTSELLPSPTRPQYVFSILHVAQVFQGPTHTASALSIFHATRSSRSTPELLVRVWQHECLRVFYDRLTEPQARKWMVETLQEVSTHFLSDYAPSTQPDPTEILLCTFATPTGGYELAEHVLRKPDGDPSAAEHVLDGENSIDADAGGGGPGGSGAAAGGGLYSEPNSPDMMTRGSGAGAGGGGSGGAATAAAVAVINRPGGSSGLIPQMSTDRALEAVYTQQQAPWVDDGRPVRAVVEERLLAVAQEFADQLFGGRGPSQEHIFVFRNAVMHLARISRVLSMDMGHLTLLGPPGCGRRTLAKLASYMCRCTLLEAKLKDDQKGFAWRDMIKSALLSAGVQGRPVTLLLVDLGRPCSCMLDDVDQLMSTGSLPDLFKPEEVASITQQLKPVARAAGLTWTDFDRTGGTSDNVLRQFFMERCRSNLHFVLVLEGEPAGLQRKVAERFLVSPEALAVDIDSWHRVLGCAVDMHGLLKPHVMRHNNKAGYNTPFMATACQFLRLLRLLRSMVPHRRQVVLTARLKYQQGVAKMTDMQDKLSALRGQIASMGPELERSRAEVEALMALIQSQKAEAEAALQRFVPAEESAKAAVAECEALRAACDAALRDVMPPLQAALRELRRIDKSSIAELKVMRNPPTPVKLVMRCICIMLGRIPPLVAAAEARAALRPNSPNRSSTATGLIATSTSISTFSSPTEDPDISEAWWAESIKLLADFHFLDMLLGYDKDAMTPEICAQVEGFVGNSMFDPVVMQRTSQAAATICKWVKAMDAFQKGRKLVDPARAALEEAEARLQVQEERLQDNHRKLTAMQERIRELESKLEQAQASRDRLDADMAVAQRKSEQAQLTIAAVVREVGRWQDNAEVQEKRHAEVLGEVLLSAAYIAYLGPVTGTVRMHVEDDWHDLLRKAGVVSPRPFRLADVLASTAQQDTWRDSQLPHSRTALENAGIMAACGSWVLLHDPQELGHRFIKGFYGGDVWLQGIGGRPVVTFLVLDQSDPSYTSQLFRAIESGSTVLLENVDEDMDDITEQLLACKLVGDTRGAVALRLGDNLIPHHKDFQLFVTTRLRSPRFPSDILRNVTVVNFSITRAQLCELLITATLRYEMPDLEHEHLVLTRQKAKGEADLMELEDQVLQAITNTSTEELLEESEVYQLLKSLQVLRMQGEGGRGKGPEAMESTDAIKAKVSRIEASQKAINIVRADTEKYFVARVTPFFFCLADLANVRHTYQFGLHWFMRLFNDALVTCLKTNSGKARLASLTMHFTTMFYANVSRSLFDEDKLPFAIMMMVRFLEASGYATKDEANLLLYGRATDSTYTAKPTFMRLASGRSGLGRTPPRRGGGHPGNARSRDTSTSGGAPGVGTGTPSPAVRRSLARSGSLWSEGSGGGGGGGGSSLPSPLGFRREGAGLRGGEQVTLEVSPEEILNKGGAAEGQDAAVPLLDGSSSPLPPSPVQPGEGLLATEISFRSGTAAAGVEEEEDPFGGMFVRRRNGPAKAPAAAPSAVTPETPSRLSRATRPSAITTNENGSGDSAALAAAASSPSDISRRTTSPFEAAQDAADAAFFAAAAGDDSGGVDAAAAAASAAAGVSTGSVRFSAPRSAVTPHSQRLSGLLPSLLSNDASAPAYLPDDLRPDWLPDESWSRLRDLGKLQPYNRVLPALFESYQSIEMLRRYYENLSRWPRGFVAQAQAAVREYLGPACVSNEQLVDFEAIFAVTEATMPIVLISSTDHTLPFLQQFADSRGISVMHMAIGRGQGAATDRLIRSAVAMDRWVILENSHLAGDWMPCLCRLVQALPLLKPHINFRLWLTMVPTSAYPDIILQSSLKLVMDPPHGIKANLLQVMSQLPVEVASNSRYATQLLPSYGADSERDPKDDVIGRKVTILPMDWKQLVLRLCLFHAMLTERLQYRSLGWRRPYEFTAADVLSAINQVMSIVHDSPAAELGAALPGLLHVVGQCLYGGKVTHDWDRRLLVCLLSQQLKPSDVAAAATLESLLPERLSSCTQDLSVVAKEVRSLAIPRGDPTLVGLSPGAASVRAAQYTRHVLDTLKRVHLLRSSSDEVDLTKPLQLALSVCQDLLKQLPLTPIPGTRSGWAAMAGPGSGRGLGPGSGGGGKPGSGRGSFSSRVSSPLGAAGARVGQAGASASVSSGGAGPGSTHPPMSPQQAAEAATREQLYRAAAMANSNYLPRYKAGKMTEEMSEAAQERWAATHPTMQKAMVQVFNDEVASFAALLNTVHASIRAVNAAIKGYEGVSEGVAELVQQLSQGHVPRSWLHQRVELQSDNIATWLTDLQTRLEFLYDWAVEGPPVAVPLGMLSRPRSFLTAVQQSFAERMSRPVGQVYLDAVLLQEDEEQMLPRYRLPQLGSRALATTPLTAADGSTLTLSTALSEGCLVGGLVLQGARWDRSRRALADPEPGVLHSGMPLLWLRATASPAVPQLARALALPGATVPTRINDSYVCPVFKFVAGFGGRNTNLLQGDAEDCLTTVLLPCGSRKAEYWAAHHVVVAAVPDPGGVLDSAGGSAWGSARESSAGTPGGGNNTGVGPPLVSSPACRGMYTQFNQLAKAPPDCSSSQQKGNNLPRTRTTHRRSFHQRLRYL